MSHSASCYPQPHKEKAQRVCEAFARGCGGVVVPEVPSRLHEGAAVFYGVRPKWLHLWRQARAEGRDYYYIDNSYLDAGRERYFRVAKNALQHDGSGTSDGARLKHLGIQVGPWRRDGRHLLVCLQSDEFMFTVAGQPTWAADIVQKLHLMTGRPMVIRRKGDVTPLQEAMQNCWAVVTWSSAAAVEAVIAGVAVHCAPECAAAPFSTPLEEIETPRRPDGREAWASVLADQQWTLEEMRDGLCWRALNGA